MRRAWRGFRASSPRSVCTRPMRIQTTAGGHVWRRRRGRGVRAEWRRSQCCLYRQNPCNMDGKLNGSSVRGQPEREPLPFRLPFANGSLHGRGSRSAESCKPLVCSPRRTLPVSMSHPSQNLRLANGRAKWHDHVDLASIASHAPLERGNAPGNCARRRLLPVGIEHLRRRVPSVARTPWPAATASRKRHNWLPAAVGTCVFLSSRVQARAGFVKRLHRRCLATACQNQSAGRQYDAGSWSSW